MILTSRRAFIRLSTSAVAAAAVPWPLGGASRDTSESSTAHQDRPFIRLNSNENAYGPSPKVAVSIKSAVELVNRYPRMQHEALAQRIAEVSRVKREQVILGCGSTELLRAA